MPVHELSEVLSQLKVSTLAYLVDPLCVPLCDLLTVFPPKAIVVHSVPCRLYCSGYPISPTPSKQANQQDTQNRDWGKQRGRGREFRDAKQTQHVGSFQVKTSRAPNVYEREIA